MESGGCRVWVIGDDLDVVDRRNLGYRMNAELLFWYGNNARDSFYMSATSLALDESYKLLSTLAL